MRTSLSGNSHVIEDDTKIIFDGYNVPGKEQEEDDSGYGHFRNK